LRHVGEEVVLDLVAEVAGQEVEQAAAGDVGRPQHLAEVPVALRLVLDLLGGELVDALGEVAAEDDRERPQVAQQVCGGVGGQRCT